MSPRTAQPSATFVTETIQTPLGPMLLGACDEGICLLEFTDRRALAGEIDELQRALGTEMTGVADVVKGPAREHLARMAKELGAYFHGSLREFTIPLHTPGTEFERRVWDALSQIPYGETRFYGGLASALGTPGGARAVGRANGRNRIAIVIPCHRVIEADGSLRGYGGGLDRKKWLLEHEATNSGHGLFRPE